MEFKYLVAQEKIEQLQTELKSKEAIQRVSSERTSTLPKGFADAAIQTEEILRDEFCQTESPEKTNFQNQANIHIERQSITTQTDRNENNENEVQVQLESEQIPPLQSIKEEIAMPNTPNSTFQSQAKKRKISIESKSCATSTDESNFEGSCNSKQDLDAGILRSEVYKIYCRNEDPKEAMKQIREMKTCIQFSEPDESVLNETDLERAFDDTLENLWRFGPAGTSKWTKIRNFLDEKYNADRIFDRIMGCSTIELVLIFDNHDSTVVFSEHIQNCFTRIEILLPNGIEYWFVKNFESGPGKSKWFRGVSVPTSWKDYLNGPKIAKLNIIGLTNVTIIGHLYLNYLKKNAEKVPWLDFAKKIVLECDTNNYDTAFDFEEFQTGDEFEAIATLAVTYRAGDETQYYRGSSTRPVKKTRRPKNEKETMKNEAEKSALMQYFHARFGFTNFDDIFRDELHRPIKM